MKRPVLYITLVFSAGIALASAFRMPIAYPIALSCLAAISAFVLHKKNNLAHASLYMALLFLGASYYTYHSAVPKDSISFLASEKPVKVFLRGVVKDDPVIDAGFYTKNKTSFLLKVDAVSLGETWKKACGYVRVISYRDNDDINFGDQISADGKLSRLIGLRDPGVFDYSRYMDLKGIHASLKVGSQDTIKIIEPASRFSIQGIAYGIRRWSRRAIDSYFDKRHAGFLKSIIIGDRAQLEETIKEDFIRTGTVHVLAVSGLNVAFVAAMSLGLLGILGIPRKANLLVTTVFLVFYTFVTGANPPIVRAVIMFAVFAFGYILERNADPINTLSIAALAILLSNPKELFDPSFQLSFASVAGIMVFAPPVIRSLKLDQGRRISLFEKARFYVLSGVAVSTAAWIGSAPLTASYFNIITPVSLLANLVIVPALSILTALSFAFLTAARIWGYLGQLFSYPIKAIDSAVFFLNHIMASMPFAYFRVPAPPAYIWILFYATIGLMFLPKKKYFLLAVLLLCNAAVWTDIAWPQKGLEVTFLDVGQGDSTHIRTPSGENILIDGSSGGVEERFDIGRSVIAPYLWNKGARRIDLLVVTHFHEDHLGGIIYILNNFEVGCVVDGGGEAMDSGLYDRYISVIKRRGIKRSIVRRGARIGPIGGVKLYVLNPPQDKDVLDPNNDSVVMKLEYGNFSALFCGDIAQGGMSGVEEYGDFIRADVIKVPHHGGNLGEKESVKRFFEKVSAKIAVISVGRQNRYGAPSKNTLDAILSSGAKMYATKDSGAVTIDASKIGTVKVTEFAGKN